MISRFSLVLMTAAFLAAAASPAPNPPVVVRGRAPLQAGSFALLPLTSVKPKGWLREQLLIQARGMSGHLDEFWPDVGPNSAWRGGTGEGWERGPYYADGLLPLAYLLDDPVLLAKAKPWVEWTLTNQRPDGGIGPEKNKDWWPNMIMLKVLTQYQEATGDPRVIPVLQKYFAYHASRAAQMPLEKWAVHRYHDEVLTLEWLYNRTGDRSLIDLARTLRTQGHDWKGQFKDFAYTEKVQKDQTNLDTHVVNNAMALKDSGVWWVITGENSDRKAAYEQLAAMDRYHGLPNGVHSGDEHYAGLNPTQGTELCAVVEGMFSVEQLMAIFGDPALGDRLEKMAYNALPAAFTTDMWGHQYDQQPNQVLADIQPRAWTSNKDDSNIFGLEPNFGCCTANYHQGWPKFVTSLWMATPDEGLVAALYGPNEVTTRVRGGRVVTIREETEYPFRETIRFTVQPDKAATFPLLFRIPSWATRASLTINGQQDSVVQAGNFHRVERRWNPGDVVELKLPMEVRPTLWYRGAVALERGPLVFSLKIGTDWKKLRDRPVAPDWGAYPTTAWNYGLRIDRNRPQGDVHVAERPVGNSVFAPETAPVELKVKGRKLPEWKMEGGSAGLVPLSPAESKEPEEELTLIPYGAAKLRITAFPLLKVK